MVAARKCCWSNLCAKGSLHEEMPNNDGYKCPCKQKLNDSQNITG